MKKQILSEEFRRMQKLAGIITESQLNENEETIDVTNPDDLSKFKAYKDLSTAEEKLKSLETAPPANAKEIANFIYNTAAYYRD